MEEKGLVRAALRARLRERGLSVTQLAVEAGEYSQNMYRFLAGEPIGAKRRARFAAAAERLGLLDDDDDATDA